MTEQQARESGRNVLVGVRAMKNVGRARERSETDGFMKVLVDAETKEILGAAVTKLLPTTLQDLRPLSVPA